ncbi:hypothetical protein JOB18_009363 [Solea senegalensis]|uniref:Uncharacterized protein n=1 Tax=Solea senegalensis TaxID=28829 RepID=A0AAV6Q5R2_SOLSE|nr:hypothetical protein JOB18_009363 [Solea senegalensis]
MVCLYFKPQTGMEDWGDELCRVTSIAVYLCPVGISFHWRENPPPSPRRKTSKPTGGGVTGAKQPFLLYSAHMAAACPGWSVSHVSSQHQNTTPPFMKSSGKLIEKYAEVQSAFYTHTSST